ncbi:nibrin isoform X2 [Lampris incognitus]|uniref:nibrin isoform X2 n=1 Tax=Lampris incognitus TaxID=2546036 RepID=UPI0024B56382|nr:nibrin isoform X2 [Lampris incognitus]
MWTLKSSEPGGDTHYLLPGKEYVVGRKNCDILLPNDQSISRDHARLTVADQTLTLKDSSKYGTCVNNQRLADNQPLKLNSGDNVIFGVFQSKFRVDFEKVVVCSSCLDNDAKVLLSQALLPLGGKLVNAWTQECTHLVMPSVKVTIKTICALLCCRPIIKLEFFTELSKAMQQKSLPPKAENFIPEIDEPTLNKEEVDLRAKPMRKRLFTGKTFLFLSTKQLKRLSIAVSFGGGRSQLLEEGSLPRSLLESPQSCVVDIATANSQILHPPSTAAWANSVRMILQEKGLRFITESEIGLAAIYSSCETFCNPSNPLTDSGIWVSDLVQSTKPRIPSATLSQNATVEETVLPAASRNVTAYVANTEPSQGCNTCTVAETMSSSFNTVEDTALHTKKPRPIFQGKKKDNTRFLTYPKANGGMKTSPQKKKMSTQGSPQKQSTLTSFFQIANKKRPREEESNALQSDPKRTLPPTSTTAQILKTSHISKQISSKTPPVTLTTGRTQSHSGSGTDLFIGRSKVLSDGDSHPTQQGAQGRKRKEMEELESIMSEDMAWPDWVSCPDKQGEQGRKRKELEELESIMSEDMGLPDGVSRSSKQREQGKKKKELEELESIMSEDMGLPDGVSRSSKQREQGKKKKELEELESIMSEDMGLPDRVSRSAKQGEQGRKKKELEELESIMSEDMGLPDRVSRSAKRGEQGRKRKELEELESIMSEDMGLPDGVSHLAKQREQNRGKKVVEGIPLEELESIMSEDITLPDGVTHPTKQREQGRARKEIEERIHVAELESIMSEDMALPYGVSQSAPQEARGRKRKEMQNEIQMEELESIMSEDMDYFDVDKLARPSQQAKQNVSKGSTDQKQQLNPVKHSTMRKRLWADPEENAKSNQRPSVSLDKGSMSNKNQSLEMRKHTSSTEKQQLCPPEQATAKQRPSNSPEQGPSAKKNRHMDDLKDEEDSEPFSRGVGQPVEVKETPLKPTVVKPEAPVSEAEDHLPKRLVLVEFKLLTVTAPSRNKPQEKQSNGFTKSFKHFRKVPVPGTVGAPQVIGGSGLMASNRGKNSELDEWFRDIAEEEHQSRQEESLGDDLFRYNPSKPKRRR